LGELFLVLVVDDVSPEVEVKTGRIAGFDFGLKTFLTCSDGTIIESPQFFKQSLNAIKKASKQHSKKLKGSSNRERARKNLVRKHEDISNRRHDWFWKLAHELTDKFDHAGEYVNIIQSDTKTVVRQRSMRSLLLLV